MKKWTKFLSLVLVLCMVLSVTTTISAEETENEAIAISAINVMAGGEGVGYHDSGETHGNATTDCVESWAHGGIMLRSGEWAAYKLPENIRPGMYSLTVNVANFAASYVDVWVNGLKQKHMLKLDPTTTEEGGADGSFRFHTERTICNVYLTGKGDVLKIGNIRSFVNIVEQQNVSQTRDYTRTADGTTTTVTYGTAFSMKDFSLEYLSDEVNVSMSYDGYENIQHTATQSLIGFVSGNSGLPNKMLILRPGTVASYNISSLPEGEYELSINGHSNSNKRFNIHLSKTAGAQDNLILEKIIFTGTGDEKTYVTSEALGTVIVTEADKYLEISSPDHGLTIDYVVLKRVNKDIVYKMHYDEPVDYYKSSMKDHPTWTIHETVTSGDWMRGEEVIEKAPITLRQDSADWYTFDISFLSPGVYNFKLERSTTSNYYCNLFTFDSSDEAGTLKKVASDVAVLSSGSWTTALVSDKLATIVVEEGTDRLKITPNSGSAIKLANFIFERVSAEDRTDYVIFCDETKNKVAGEGFYAGTVTVTDETTGEEVAVNRETYEAPIEVKRKYDAVMMRSGYFMAYDTENIPAGLYEVYLDRASYYDTTAELKLDGEVVHSFDLPATTKESYNLGMTTYAKILIGTVNIGLESEELVLKTKGALNYRSLTLVPVVKTKIYGADGKLTKDITEGNMTVKTYLDDSYDTENILYVYAVYKKNTATGITSLYKAYVESGEKDKFYGEISNIEKEDGYEYFQKVFVWDSASLNGYGF